MKQRRPKESYMRTIERELKSMRYTWKEAEKVAKQCDEWRRFVMALCDSYHKEVR